MIIAELYLVCCFLMSHYFTEGANVPWSRDGISACECDEKSYRHVHCPCFACDGRATDRKTELRHWKETSELAATNSAGVLNSDFWSGFVTVESQPHTNSIVFLVDDICRKVILYPSDDNLLTVVDYMRPFKNFPYPLIVPVYPEVGDMVLIQGESNEAIWHGHIQSVDFNHKTVELYFYVPSLRFPNSNIYVRKIRGRGARNTVAWGSVISIAEGHWDSASTWIKAI